MIRQLENHLAIPSRHPSTTHRSFSILQKPELFTSTRSTHACASISWDDIAGNDFYVLFLTSIVCSHFFVPKTNVEKEHTFSWGILRVFKVGLLFFSTTSSCSSEGLSYNHSEDANASYKAWYKEKRIKGCLPQRQIMGILDFMMAEDYAAAKDGIALLAGVHCRYLKAQAIFDKNMMRCAFHAGRMGLASVLCPQEGAPAGVFMNRQLNMTSSWRGEWNHAILARREGATTRTRWNWASIGWCASHPKGCKKTWTASRTRRGIEKTWVRGAKMDQGYETRIFRRHSLRWRITIGSQLLWLTWRRWIESRIFFRSEISQRLL